MRTAQIRARGSARKIYAGVRRLMRHPEREPLRTLYRSVTGFLRHNDMLWASALTYTSSLALVPILAIALSAVKGLGGVEKIKPLIERFLAVNSADITDKILQFVANVNARALGEVGGAVLLVTVVLTLGTIENAFNAIFHVARGRTWLRKFADYLSLTFTMPLLAVAAVGIGTRIAHEIPHLPGLAWIAATIPVWAGFSFLYMFFPNTRVTVRAAAIGGLAAAVLLQTGQWGYLRFQVGAARYQAIYGALAAVPILLTWIYLAWLIVLYGAELTAAAQGIEAEPVLEPHSPKFARAAALLTVARAGERMLGRENRRCTVASVAAELGVAEAVLAPVIHDLERAGIIVESAAPAATARARGRRGASRGGGLSLARDSSVILIADVLGCLETAPASARVNSPMAAVLGGLAAAERGTLGALTVKDLVRGDFALMGAPVSPGGVKETD